MKFLLPVLKKSFLILHESDLKWSNEAPLQPFTLELSGWWDMEENSSHDLIFTQAESDNSETLPEDPDEQMARDDPDAITSANIIGHSFSELVSGDIASRNFAESSPHRYSASFDINDDIPGLQDLEGISFPFFTPEFSMRTRDIVIGDTPPPVDEGSPDEDLNDCPVVEDDTIDLDILKEDDAVAGTDVLGNIIAESGAFDLDGDPITVASVGGLTVPFVDELEVDGVVVGTIEINEDGSYVIDLDEIAIQALNQDAMETFTYTINLTDGGFEPGTNEPCITPVTLAFDIMGQNDCPVVTVDVIDLDTFKEDDAMGDFIFVSGNIIAESGAFDPDGDLIIVASIGGLPAPFSEVLEVDGVAVGAINITEDGSYTISMPEFILVELGQDDMETFSYTINLTDGSLEPGTDELCITPVTLTFDIMGQNDCPMVTVDVVDLDTLKEDDAVPGVDVRGDIIAESGAFDPDGDPITVDSIGGQSVPFREFLEVEGRTVGVISIFEDGSYSIDLEELAIQSLPRDAMETFSYTINLTDGSLEPGTNEPCITPVTLTFDIMGQNDCPIVRVDVVDLDTLKEDDAVNGVLLVEGNIIAESFTFDPDGDPISVASVDGLDTPFMVPLEVEGVPVGTILIFEDGFYSIQLAGFALETLGQDDMETFTYTINLTDGGFEPGTNELCIKPVTLTFDIMGQNDCPVVTVDTIDLDILKEDDAVADVDVTGNIVTESGATDVDGDDITVATVNGANAPFSEDLVVDGIIVGTIMIGLDGSYEIDLNEVAIQALDQEAMESFTYNLNLTDGNLDPVTGQPCLIPVTLTFDIMGQNDCPVVTVDTINLDTFKEDDTVDGPDFTGNIIAESGAFDPDGASIFIEVDSVGGLAVPFSEILEVEGIEVGIIIIFEDGTYVIDLIELAIQELGQDAMETFSYTINLTDGELDPITNQRCLTPVTLTFDIMGQNDCPTADDAMIVVAEANGNTASQDLISNLNIDLNIQDPEDDPITFLSVNGIVDEGAGDADGIINGSITIIEELGGETAATLTVDLGTGTYTFSQNDDNPFLQQLGNNEQIIFSYSFVFTDGQPDPMNPNQNCEETATLEIVIDGVGDLIETECESFPVFLFGDADFYVRGDIRDILLMRELGQTADQPGVDGATNFGLLGRSAFFDGTAGPGNDVVINGSGNISGGNGNDYLQGDNGVNAIAGGADNDILLGEGGNDRISGGACGDYMNGGSGQDRINGGASQDLIDGGTGNDTLNGNAMSDVIVGGAGFDEVNGGSGDDILSGDQGNDTLSGSSGADVFVFDLVNELNIGQGQLELQFGDQDTIEDWNQGAGDDFLGFIDHTTTAAGAFTGILTSLDTNQDFRLDDTEASQADLAARGITVSVVGPNTILQFDGGGDITIAGITDANFLDTVLAGPGIQVVDANYYSA